MNAEAAAAHFNVPADIVAILDFPDKQDPTKTKRVGLVDFGEDLRGKQLLTWAKVLKPTERYGLIGLNYEHGDQLVGYMPVAKGQYYDLGNSDAFTDLKRPNWKLGIDLSISDYGAPAQSVRVGYSNNGQLAIEGLAPEGFVVELSGEQ